MSDDTGDNYYKEKHSRSYKRNLIAKRLREDRAFLPKKITTGKQYVRVKKVDLLNYDEDEGND